MYRMTSYILKVYKDCKPSQAEFLELIGISLALLDLLVFLSSDSGIVVYVLPVNC